MGSVILRACRLVHFAPEDGHHRGSAGGSRRWDLRVRVYLERHVELYLERHIRLYTESHSPRTVFQAPNAIGPHQKT